MPIEYHNGNPIFLISPPGSLEAAEIGYINIPKIVNEPPDEIREIHNFTSPEDKRVQSIAKGLIKNDFIVVDRMKYSTRHSNCWIYRPFIESKKVSHDLLLPFFPEFLRNSVIWMVLEYGLYCVKNEDKIGFEAFTVKTIGRRAEDFPFVGIALLKKDQEGEHYWRGTSRPLHYLRVVISREKRAIEKLEHQNRVIRKGKTKRFECEKCDTIFRNTDGIAYYTSSNSYDIECPFCYVPIEKNLFGVPSVKYISFDTPIFTGRILEEQSADDGFLKELLVDNNIEQMIDSQELNDTCRSKWGLSEEAAKLYITKTQNQTTYADAAMHLSMSKKEYHRFRREIERKLKSYLADHNKGN